MATTIERIAPLLASLPQTISMVVRERRPTGDYFEGVLSQQEVARCCALLQATFGPAAKDFGKTARFEAAIQRAVDRLGGVRLEQCVFYAQPEPQRIAYATLWPWASDAGRVTLKIGILELR